MAERTRGSLSLLLFLFFCHGVGFLLFCKGFLLKRVVIPEFTNCTMSTEPHLHSLDENSNKNNNQAVTVQPSCYPFPRPYKRAVWLLVDALRYDFVLFDDSLPDPVPVYRNKLPFIRDLLRDNSGNARLFKFVADPPTTTMQRLKALTTGSLPTFIDVGSNFNSYAVSEDSLPYQFKANRRNLTFIGDDTWLGLYPDMLTKVFDYPSLNVQDLDTVDNGVMQHLGPELSLGDADLVIGHMLGVDHVGHTYGPSHWIIEKKLTQVNNFIRKLVTEVMDEESILFIFGDHGMTPTGDHGGETSLETDAALIVYSKKPLFDPSEPSVGRVIDQVDIVPTTALVLGLPIPFSNLGTAIPEVLLPYMKPENINRRDGDAKKRPNSTKDQNKNRWSVSNGFDGRVTLDFLEVLRASAVQLHTYLVTYAQYSEDFPSADFETLETDFNELMKDYKQLLDGLDVDRDTSSTLPSQQRLTELAQKFMSFTKSVKKMCSRVWAKFDDTPIQLGLFLLAVSVAVSTVMLLDARESANVLFLSLPVGGTAGVMLGMIGLFFTGVEFSLQGLIAAVFNIAFACLLSILAVFLVKFRFVLFRYLYYVLDTVFKGTLSGTKLELMPFLAVVLSLFHAVSLSSNSFVLYESDMLAFFIQSVVFYMGLQALQSSFVKTHRDSGASMRSVFGTLTPYLAIMACVRLSKAFYSCRDLQLQDGCVSLSFVQGLASAGDSLSWLANWRLATSCLAVVAVPLGFVLLMRFAGVRSLMSRRLAFVCEGGLTVTVLCVVVHWNLQNLAHQSRWALLPWQHTAPPLTAYLVTIVVILTAILWPFKRPVVNHFSSEYANWDNQELPVKSTAGDPLLRPTSEGFEYVSLRQRAEIVVKDAVTYSSSEGVKEKEKDDGNFFRSGMSAAVVVGVIEVAVWVPLAMLLNDGIALSAFLSAVEIVCALYIFRKHKQGGILEMCALWVFLASHSFFSFSHHATVTSLRFDSAFVGIHGEITKYNLPLAGLLVGLNTVASQILFGLSLPLLVLLRGYGTKQHSLSDQLLRLFLTYCVLQSWKLVTTVASASIHRRHLMVWLVFAPRCLYEGGFQFVTNLAVVLGLCLTDRLQKVLHSS